MTTYESESNESTDLEPRTERSLTQCMTALPQGGDVYSVTTESGNEYLVDFREARCTCPDHQHRRARCKHIRRVAFATGAEPIPEGIEEEQIDDQLGTHIDSDQQQSQSPVIADGGTASAGRIEDESSDEEGATHDIEQSGPGSRVRVPVSGGTLVYEQRQLGKELVGLEEVEEWDDLADALAARGHNRGAVFHLPELDTVADDEGACSHDDELDDQIATQFDGSDAAADASDSASDGDDAHDTVVWVDVEHESRCPQCGSGAIQHPAEVYSFRLKPETARCGDCGWFNLNGVDMAYFATVHPGRSPDEIEDLAYQASEFWVR